MSELLTSFLILFGLSVASFAKPVLPSKPVLLNGTAASVGKELVTVQDAYVYHALSRFKAGERPAVQIQTGEDLRKTVQKVAFEEMVYLELKSFSFEAGTKIDAEREIGVAKAKAKGKQKEWNSIVHRFQVSESQLADRWFRTIQVERFMQKKVDTLTPIVTLAEAEKYFADNPTRFKGSAFELMKANIQVLLKKQQIQKGLEEWIQFLKEKYGFAILLEG